MSPRPETSGGSATPRQPGAGDGSRAASGRAPGEPEELDAHSSDAPRSEDVERVDSASEPVEEDLDVALSMARGERDEYLEMLRRVQADFENYKKRMLRQQTELLERAAEGLVVRLLPALESFDLARSHLGDADELSPEGKALLQASALLFDTLEKEGLERVGESAVPFDPTVHEAVDHEPADPTGEGDDPEDESAESTGGPVVVEVLRAGYRWKGRVIRPAMVRVRG